MKKLLTTALALFAASLVFAQNAPTDSALISGKINLRPDWRPRLYLIKPLNYRQLNSSFEGLAIDSAEIAPDGSFQFFKKNDLVERGLFRLCIQPSTAQWNNGIEPDCRENTMFLVLGPDSKIRLEANAWEFARTCKIENPDADNALLAKIRDFRWFIFREAETDLALAPRLPDVLRIYADPPLTKHSEKVRDSLLLVRLNARTDALRQEKLRLKNYLDTATYAPFPAFVALQRYNKFAAYQSETDFFMSLGYRLTNFCPPEARAWVDDFCQRVSRFKPTRLVGDTLPDFGALTVSGDSLRFSALRGKLKLAFFWISTKPACHDFQQNYLAPLYADFHKNGLEIFGFSADAQIEKWKSALQTDKPAWPNVHDPKGRGADILYEIDIRDYPTVVVTDASGRILGRNLSGAELRRLVEAHVK